MAAGRSKIKLFAKAKAFKIILSRVGWKSTIDKLLLDFV